MCIIYIVHNHAKRIHPLTYASLHNPQAEGSREAPRTHQAYTALVPE